MKGLIAASVHLIKEIFTALPKWIKLVAALIVRLCKLEWRSHGKQSIDCLPIPSGVYLRPDACIYSQQYLMSVGMAVTWDNPDVTLTDALNNVVGSHDLKPSTPYTVTASIHNRKNDTPVPSMPVVFKLIGFGVSGPTVQDIGSTVVDLPVRGAPGEPARASVTWTTPPTPGHYCIVIEAVVTDDANPLDNVGQHNTVVQGVARGQAIVLRFPVHNPLQGARTFAVRLHSYQLPTEPLVRGGLGEHARRAAGAASTGGSRGPRESDASLLARVVAANRAELFPAPPEWEPAVSQAEVTVEPDRPVELVFTATVPNSAPTGLRQPFHISVSEQSTNRPVGGVTTTYVVT
jgi:hypothetical protein